MQFQEKNLSPATDKTQIRNSTVSSTVIVPLIWNIYHIRKGLNTLPETLSASYWFKKECVSIKKGRVICFKSTIAAKGKERLLLKLKTTLLFLYFRQPNEFSVYSSYICIISYTVLLVLNGVFIKYFVQRRTVCEIRSWFTWAFTQKYLVLA